VHRQLAPDGLDQLVCLLRQLRVHQRRHLLQQPLRAVGQAALFRQRRRGCRRGLRYIGGQEGAHRRRRAGARMARGGGHGGLQRGMSGAGGAGGTEGVHGTRNALRSQQAEKVGGEPM
jgi:hypothetical protein